MTPYDKKRKCKMSRASESFDNKNYYKHFCDLCNYKRDLSTSIRKIGPSVRTNVYSKYAKVEKKADEYDFSLPQFVKL